MNRDPETARDGLLTMLLLALVLLVMVLAGIIATPRIPLDPATTLPLTQPQK